jgi:hypothetical protein
MNKTTRAPFHLCGLFFLGCASVVSAQVLTPSVEDASLTWPTGTGFGGFVSTTDDALGPFFAETVHFRGRSTGGELQVYRYRLEFDEPVVLRSVVVEGAAWAGGASLPIDLIRLFDADYNLISAIDALAGSSQFQSVEILGNGAIGQTYFLEELNGDDIWRYRSNIVVDYESEPTYPYIGEAVSGIILDAKLAPGSAGSAGVIQTGGLIPGVEAFVDRVRQRWSMIPSQLVGADFIQTAQNNADVSPVGIEVTVAHGTILHMLVPEHDDLLPFDWMNSIDFGADWVNTGAVVGTSWSSPAQIWSTITPLPAGTYTFRGLPTNLSFYGIAATKVEQISVPVDIKPGSDGNPINLGSKGNIPVAILTSDTFDATQVNWETVSFGPSGAAERHQRVHVKDADYDGDMDVVLHFKTRDTGILCGDTEATLTGETFSGEKFTGSDVVKIVKCPKNKKNKKKKRH